MIQGAVQHSMEPQDSGLIPMVVEDNVVAWVMAGAKVTEQTVKLNELMES